MTSRDLVVRLTLDGVTGLERGFKSAAASASVFEKELAKVEAKQAAFKNQVGKGLLVTGAAIAAGLALSTKAAIDWESAWAGVTKTVSGTPKQLAALEGGLRDLAKTLPASHEEIAGVAEAAGQLGIQRGAILGFTKTMIDLGVSTNLSAEDAATALARLLNVMGTSATQVDRLGATLVALGNNGASTESEITDMALRIAGAGKTIGLSTDQVLAFANGLSSVGIQAEAGGSAISTTFIKIAAAVDKGGKDLDAFARVAGSSADDFAQKFREAPAQAILDFVNGLGQMRSTGQSVFKTLDDLGLSSIRVRDTLLRTANAGAVLNDSLKTGAKAWQDDTALVNEANKRYETTAARLAIARNQVTDLGISIGQNLLPVLGRAAADAGALADAINQLPQPVKESLTVIAALASAVTVAGGAFFLAAPKVVAFNAAVETMGPKGKGFSKALRGTATFLTGPYGVALAAATFGLGKFLDIQEQAKQRTEELTAAIQADGGALADNTRIAIAHQLQQHGLLDAASKLGLQAGVVTAALTGNAEAMDTVRQAINGVIQAGDVYVDETGTHILGVSEDQYAAATDLNEAMGVTKGSLHDAVSAYQREAAAQNEAAAAAQGFTGQTKSAAQAAEDAATAADDYKKQLDALNGVNISAAQQQIALKRAYNDTKKAIGGGKKVTLDERDALLSLAEQANETAAAVVRQTGDQNKGNAVLREARKHFIATAEAMGMSANQARRLADNILALPEHSATDFKAPGLPFVLSQVARLGDMIAGLPSSKTVTIRTVRGGNRSVLNPAMLNADGGVVQFFADGEDHVAQIAPAGSWRVWAEPETGGEAYIPLAPGKRGRSKAILSSVAQRFGGEVTYHADGYTPGSDRYSASDLLSMADDKKGRFRYGRFEHLLATALTRNRTYRQDLERIAARFGPLTAQAVEALGPDAAGVAHKLAHGPKKADQQAAARIRKLSDVSRPTSLADLLKQTRTSNRTTAAFQANLNRLAGRGQLALARYLSDLESSDPTAAERYARQALANPAVARQLNVAVARQAGLGATVDASGSATAAGGAGAVRGGNGAWFNPTVNLFTLPAQDPGKQVAKGLQYVATMHFWG